MSKNIGIIGAGAIGQALAKAFSKANEINFWDIDKSKCSVESQQQLVDKSHIIFLGVPSWAVKEIAESIKTNEPKIVITVAKGVEKGFETMAEVLSKASNDTYTTGVLYGPMLADELSSRKPTSSILATQNEESFNQVQSLANNNFELIHSKDMQSVALCGSLKNIYAVAFGLCDGLNLGSNAKGVLATKVIAEMQNVLAKLNADPNVSLSLAGIGDLLATGFSELSFNHRTGLSIAKGEKVDKHSSEGVNALMEIGSVVDVNEFAILSSLTQIINQKQNATTFEEIILSQK